MNHYIPLSYGVLMVLLANTVVMGSEKDELDGKKDVVLSQHNQEIKRSPFDDEQLQEGNQRDNASPRYSKIEALALLTRAVTQEQGNDDTGVSAHSERTDNSALASPHSGRDGQPMEEIQPAVHVVQGCNPSEARELMRVDEPGDSRVNNDGNAAACRDDSAQEYPEELSMRSFKIVQQPSLNAVWTLVPALTQYRQVQFALGDKTGQSNNWLNTLDGRHAVENQFIEAVARLNSVSVDSSIEDLLLIKRALSRVNQGVLSIRVQTLLSVAADIKKVKEERLKLLNRTVEEEQNKFDTDITGIYQALQGFIRTVHNKMQRPAHMLMQHHDQGKKFHLEDEDIAYTDGEMYERLLSLREVVDGQLLNHSMKIADQSENSDNSEPCDLLSQPVRHGSHPELGKEEEQPAKIFWAAHPRRPGRVLYSLENSVTDDNARIYLKTVKGQHEVARELDSYAQQLSDGITPTSNDFLEKIEIILQGCRDNGIEINLEELKTVATKAHAIKQSCLKMHDGIIRDLRKKSSDNINNLFAAACKTIYPLHYHIRAPLKKAIRLSGETTGYDSDDDVDKYNNNTIYNLTKALCQSRATKSNIFTHQYVLSKQS